MGIPNPNLVAQTARILKPMVKVAGNAPSAALGRGARVIAGATPETLLERSERGLSNVFKKAEQEAASVYDRMDSTLHLALRSNHIPALLESVANASNSLRKASFSRWLSTGDRAAMLTEVSEGLRGISLRAHLDPAGLLRELTKNGYVNTLAGAIREVYGRNLRPIRQATLDRLVHADEARVFGSSLEVVDSRILGSVRLRTRLVEGERNIALGSDRIVATGMRDPKVVKYVNLEGRDSEILVIGALSELNIVAEVKGRTTATDALQQFVNLDRRGAGGYVLMGDGLWLMPPLDRSKVKFFAVAPEGEFLMRAERQAKVMHSQGYLIDVLPIDAAVDQEIYEVAREIMAGYVELAKSLIP